MRSSHSWIAKAGAVALVLAAAGTASLAQAGGNVYFSVSGAVAPGVVVSASNAPYYQPYQPYYQPAPVYYAPPPPVYVAPAPVYYVPRYYVRPAPVVVGYGHGHHGPRHGHGRGHHRHHRH